MEPVNRKVLDYGSYISSDQWRKQHPKWLQKAGYRCAMFWWIRIGKGRRYNIHHMNRKAYERQGCERYGRDVIALSPFAHWFIHSVLGGADRVSKQKSSFPNALQRIANFWCCLPLFVKPLLSIVSVWYLLRTVW